MKSSKEGGRFSRSFSAIAIFFLLFFSIPIEGSPQSAPAGPESEAGLSPVGIKIGTQNPLPRSPAGIPLPQDLDKGFVSSFYSCRDAAYNDENPRAVQGMADALLSSPALAGMPAGERYILISRIEFLAGRAWMDGGDKKNAAASFEAARAAARKAGAGAAGGGTENGRPKGAGPDPEISAAITAEALALSELCMLKDFVFLLANGPSISPDAKKALALDPGNVRARITLASAKAYAPVVWGGDYKGAIAELADLLDSNSSGFEKDDLFDIRACMGTAYANMKNTEEARFWFSLALQLFPGNNYAKKEMGKLSK